ncbi:restriction endonuclease subunit S, partial [Staphylococcus intermedius]
KWHRVAASSRKDPNITKKDIENFKIPNTSIKEQNKISDFFVKLDRQIELEEQKLTLLEEQKKGYMQKIFSQELRFKDDNGNDYPEWTISKLGDLGTTFSGLSSKDKEDFGHGDAKFITYMNVFKNNIAKQKLTEKVNVKNNEKQNLVEYGDVLFTTSSEVPHEVGMSSVWLYEENVYLNSFCFGFRLNVNYINSVYLSRVLRSQKMRKMITILAQGSTRFNISKKELMKLNIDIPSMEEQHKIIDFISNMDQLIEKQFHKVDLLKQRKQGFLQKMFV